MQTTFATWFNNDNRYHLDLSTSFEENFDDLR